MKTKLISALFLSAALSCLAQSTNTFVSGTMDIKFNTQTGDSTETPKAGVFNRYTLNINMDNSTVFNGTIDYTPLILGLFDKISQPASLNYNVDCAVINPKRPSDAPLKIGRLYGIVPIEQTGLYKYGAGTLKIFVERRGKADQIDSKFTGTAAGKPLIKKGAGLKGDVMNMLKSIKGQTVAIPVKSYDKMTFTDHKLAAGPVSYYPEATVNGTMIYDYDRFVWYFKNVSISYPLDGTRHEDRLTGNIRWVESKTGGEYQFDVRINEPPVNEAALFATATDESAYFQTDDSLTSMLGTMKYKDTKANGATVASAIIVDLTGNKMTRIQTMNLVKLILISAIIPLNSD